MLLGHSALIVNGGSRVLMLEVRYTCYWRFSLSSWKLIRSFNSFHC